MGGVCLTASLWPRLCADSPDVSRLMVTHSVDRTLARSPLREIVPVTFARAVRSLLSAGTGG